MLSQLLRRLLLFQVLAGALLGWFIARQSGASPWMAVPVALLLTVPADVSASLTSFVPIICCRCRNCWPGMARLSCGSSRGNSGGGGFLGSLVRSLPHVGADNRKAI